MTIPEASKLVIQAGAFAKGGEIFILDMGEPVKIIDLAHKMIDMSGKKGIGILEIGVRPGEKIHEELMSKSEIMADHVLPKTFVSTSKPLRKEDVLSIITSLFGLDDLNLKRAIVYDANQY
jgi:FlaA1/EpsC-like NDP-sugar epimerase